MFCFITYLFHYSSIYFLSEEVLSVLPPTFSKHLLCWSCGQRIQLKAVFWTLGVSYGGFPVFFSWQKLTPVYTTEMCVLTQLENKRQSRLTSGSGFGFITAFIYVYVVSLPLAVGCFSVWRVSFLFSFYIIHLRKHQQELSHSSRGFYDTIAIWIRMEYLPI